MDRKAQSDVLIPGATDSTAIGWIIIGLDVCTFHRHMSRFSSAAEPASLAAVNI